MYFLKINVNALLGIYLPSTDKKHTIKVKDMIIFLIKHSDFLND